MVRTSLLNLFDLRTPALGTKSLPDQSKPRSVENAWRAIGTKSRPDQSKLRSVENAWHQAKALDNIKPAFVNPRLDEDSKANLADFVMSYIMESEKASQRFSDFMINPKEKELFIPVDINREFSLLSDSDSTLPDSDSTFRLLGPLKIIKSEKELGLDLETDFAIKIKPNEAEIHVPLRTKVLEVFPPPHIQSCVINYVDYLINKKLDTEPSYFQDLKESFKPESFHVFNIDDLIPQSLLDTKRDKPKLNFINEWLIKKGKTQKIDLDDLKEKSSKNVLTIQQVDRCHISVEKYLEDDKTKIDFYLHIPIEYIYAGQRYQENIMYPLGSSEA
jgi:hypothetical protein